MDSAAPSADAPGASGTTRRITRSQTPAASAGNPRREQCQAILDRLEIAVEDVADEFLAERLRPPPESASRTARNTFVIKQMSHLLHQTDSDL